jgi:hypothetical protein
MKMNNVLRMPDPGEGGGAPALDLSILPEDLRGEASLSQIKTIPDLAKSYVNAQKLIGAEKIAKPQKNWKPEQWNEFYNNLGRPQDITGYTFKPENLPPDMGVNDEKLGEARKVLHEAGLSDSQATKVLKYYFESATKNYQDGVRDSENKKVAAISQLKTDWGDKFDTKLNLAQSVVKKFGGEEIKEFLEKHGNDPQVIKLFSSIGESMLEDSAEGAGNDLMVGDPAQAQAEINTLKSDKEFMEAFLTKNHPGHKVAVERWSVLHEKAFPSK